jgi:hypothetical protein
MIEVWSASDLNNVRNDLGGDYVQKADIDLSGYDWEPIGNHNTPFYGNYDGGDFQITNLSITLPFGSEEMYYGLFGCVDYSHQGDSGVYTPGLIQNTHIRSTNQMGILVDSTFHASGGTGVVCGALIGQIIGGSVLKCDSTGSINTMAYSNGNPGGGGGWPEDPAYQAWVACSKVSYGAIVGGLIGINIGANIRQCYSTVNIHCNIDISSYILYPGFAIVNWGNDWIDAPERITEAYSRVRESITIGGLIGKLFNAEIYNLAWYWGDGSAHDCYARGTMSIPDPSISQSAFEADGLDYPTILRQGGRDGFVGVSSNYVPFENCYSTGGYRGFNASGYALDTNCYFDEATSEGAMIEGNGNPDQARSTTQMQRESTFVDWDFVSIWKLSPSRNDGYPYFGGYEGRPDGPTCNSVRLKNVQSQFLNFARQREGGPILL